MTRQTKTSQLSSVLQKVDKFGTDASFRENGKDSFTTNCGAFISILIMALVVMYGSEKLDICLDHLDTTQQAYIEEFGPSRHNSTSIY